MKYHMNDVTKNNFHFVLITEEEYFDYSTYEYYQLSLQKTPKRMPCSIPTR